MLTKWGGGVKRLSYKFPFFISIVRDIRHYFRVSSSLRKTKIENHSKGKLIKDILGNGNTIVISSGTSLTRLKVRIRGNNNHLEIGKNCTFGKECSIWLEGDNINVSIGQGSTFVWKCHINAQENGSKISIGESCMFSNHIIVRTSDSHPIFDLSTGERINLPKPIVIGDYVWIAPNSKIMKGAVIANGCIIGSDTTVSKEFSVENSLIVGRPAKVVRNNVRWTREKLF